MSGYFIPMHSILRNQHMSVVWQRWCCNAQYCMIFNTLKIIHSYSLPQCRKWIGTSCSVSVIKSFSLKCLAESNSRSQEYHLLFLVLSPFYYVR